MTVQTITDMARSPIALPQTLSQVSSVDSVLIDLTLCARTGLRGEKAAQVLEQAGYKVPSQPNQMTDSEQVTVLRLSANEFWLLTDVEGKTLPDFSMQEGCYPLFCQDSHAWFAFKSPFKTDVMAKLCSVDLSERAFPVGMIVQTVVAGTNAIVVHQQLSEDAFFSILCDRSVAHYLWEVMLDAMQEFSGMTADASLSV